MYDPSGSGGITHYTFELATALVEHGCRVTVITSEDYELRHLTKNFDTWYLFKRSRLRDIYALLRRRTERLRADTPPASHPQRFASSPASQQRFASVLSAIRTVRKCVSLTKAAAILLFNGTQIVHLQWIADRAADLYFIRLLRLCRLKIVYTVHDLLPHDAHTAQNRDYFEKVYRQADRLIVHSHNNKREMLELFDIESDTVQVIPHGSHRVSFAYQDTQKDEARARLGLPSHVDVILFFGLIKQYKGLEYLLQAFDVVVKKYGHAKLVIAGKIDDSNSDMYRHYSMMLEQCARRADILVENGYVPVDSVSSYFAAADIVVLPYTKASQSGVLLSAYAAGKPVVVTETGSLSETVRHGVSGFVVPPQNADALADAILQILTDSTLKEKMGAEASRLARTVYSWQHIAKLTLHLYEGVGS